MHSIVQRIDSFCHIANKTQFTGEEELEELRQLLKEILAEAYEYQWLIMSDKLDRKYYPIDKIRVILLLTKDNLSYTISVLKEFKEFI